MQARRIDTSRRYRSPYSHVYSPRSLHRILTLLRFYDSNTRKQEFSYDARGLYILSTNYVCVYADACVRACGRHDYRVRVCPRETHVAGGRPHACTHTHTRSHTYVRARGHGRPALSRDSRDFAENRVCWNNLFARPAFAQRKLIRQESESSQWLTVVLSNTRDSRLSRTNARLLSIWFIGKSMRLNRTRDNHIFVHIYLTRS